MKENWPRACPDALRNHHRKGANGRQPRLSARSRSNPLSFRLALVWSRSISVSSPLCPGFVARRLRSVSFSLRLPLCPALVSSFYRVRVLFPPPSCSVRALSRFVPFSLGRFFVLFLFRDVARSRPAPSPRAQGPSSTAYFIQPPPTYALLPSRRKPETVETTEGEPTYVREVPATAAASCNLCSKSRNPRASSDTRWKLFRSFSVPCATGRGR